MDQETETDSIQELTADLSALLETVRRLIWALQDRNLRQDSNLQASAPEATR